MGSMDMPPVSSFWNQILEDLSLLRIGASCLSGSLDVCQGSGVLNRTNTFAADFWRVQTTS